MLSASEKIIEQVSESTLSPLKNYLDIKNNRKNLLLEYGTQKEIELIDKVMSSESVDTASKVFLSSYIKSGAKKFYNQVKILGIALDQVKDNDKILQIDTDWINDFWEKAKNISDEGNQNIWGNILYYNFVNGTCTKTLLNSLYLLDRVGRDAFDTIRKFTFVNMSNHLRVYSCIYFKDNTAIYKNLGLHKYILYQLSTIGLLETDWIEQFILPNTNISLKYGNKIININSSERLQYGNVRLTSDGSLLFNALQPVYDEDCFKFCVDKWKENHGIFFNIEG